MKSRNEIISNVIKILDDSDNCCVLRKAEFVFKSSMSDDIDILVTSEINYKLWIYLKTVGFKRKKDSHFFNNYLYGSQPHIHYFNKGLDLHFDCVMGIYHKSLHSLSYPGFKVTHWIPLDQFIQEESRKTIKYQYIEKTRIPCLSHEVELVHLVSHILLDKYGMVSEYYKRRIKYLLACVDIQRVEKMLELVFFSFTQKLLDYLKEGNLDTIYSNYLRYGEY